MDMKINRVVLKQLRKDRLWSQEHLAELSSLSLRTIQRIESSGSASMESVSVLAVAFDVDKHTLLVPEPIFKPYTHTQLAYFTWVVCFTILCVCGAIPNMPVVGYVMLLIGTIVPLVLFFSLTIKVSEDKLSWYFGPRFWAKELSLGDVESCKVVRNSPLMGWGIRLLGDGWMYNVSGLLAVEIRLSSGSVIRLGSDEPNYLKKSIDDALALRKSKAI